MITHLLKLAWNRRRTAFLLWLEMLVSFLVLSILGISTVNHVLEVFRPRGFDDDGVWAVVFIPEDGMHWGRWTAADSVVARQAYQMLKIQPGTLALCEVVPLPYHGQGSNVAECNSQRLDYYLAHIGDGFASVLAVPLAAGRWPGPEDDGLDAEPVVLNRIFATALFGADDPLGRRFALDREGRQGRVVGVVEEYRPYLFVEQPGRFAIIRSKLDRPISQDYPELPVSYLVRVAPGTPRSYAQDIEERLAAVAPDWRVEMARPLIELRQQGFRYWLRPLMVGVVVGAFLLAMVSLGLLGVLWQNLTQRTREIGIRRATGASTRAICLQFVGEMLVQATLAVAIGSLLVLHSTVLDLFPHIAPGTYLAGLLSAAAVLYLLVAAASAYPGWLATRIHPAEALHYE